MDEDSGADSDSGKASDKWWTEAEDVRFWEGVDAWQKYMAGCKEREKMKGPKKRWEWVLAENSRTGHFRHDWQSMDNRYKNVITKYKAILYYNKECSGGRLSWDATRQNKAEFKKEHLNKSLPIEFRYSSCCRPSLSPKQANHSLQHFASLFEVSIGNT